MTVPIPSLYNQKAIKKGESYHGLWKLEVAQAGTYEISLRRFPAESGLNFSDTPPKGEAVEYEKAELKIGTVSETKSVDMASDHVIFTVKLEAGPVEMDATLIDNKGKKTSAYYVYVFKQ